MRLGDGMNWNTSDDGYMWACGRNGRYEISDYGMTLARVRLPSGMVVFCCWDLAKTVCEDFDQ